MHHTLEFEEKRKIFHVLGTLCPIIYHFIPKEVAIALLTCITLFVIYLDKGRHTNPKIQMLVNIIFSKVMRENEKRHNALSSGTWTSLGVLLTCIIFPKEITIMSWWILFICDAMAAIIGRRFGTTKTLNNKTLEGSLAFFTTAILISVLGNYLSNMDLSSLNLVIACTLTTGTELYAKKFKIDDNFAIPLVYATSISLLNHIF